MNSAPRRGRWDIYGLIVPDSFSEFWTQHLAESKRSVLFIVGKGFDPRATVAARSILESGGEGERECVLLNYRGGRSTRPEVQLRVEENVAELRSLFGDRLEERVLPTTSPTGRRVASRGAVRVFGTGKELDTFTDVVLDISALPREIFLTLIAHLLHLIDHQRPALNLHVVAVDHPRLDSSIVREGVEDQVLFLPGFSGGHHLEAAAAIPRVWFPVLGEGRLPHLEKIFDFLTPDEVNPIIPWPSRNPRRGDDLVAEYRELLFDRFEVATSDFIYASEQNPFQVYRELRTSILRAHQTLQPLGGCRAFVSPLSSKLLSVGALLACYELREDLLQVGVPLAPGFSHSMAATTADVRQGKLYSLWLTGDCYPPLGDR